MKAGFREPRLTAAQRVVLARAHAAPLSYGVRILVSDTPSRRTVVALGEAHLKLGPASKLGKTVINAFELRGVETVQARRIFAGRLAGFLIHAPRLVLRVLSLGLVKGSTITDAKRLSHGTTTEIEDVPAIPFGLHVSVSYLAVFFLTLFGLVGLDVARSLSPALWAKTSFIHEQWTWVLLALELHFLTLLPALLLRDRSWSWLIHPLMGIITLRDKIMAEGTLRLLERHSGEEPVLVIMGRAHLEGFERELTKQHGFCRIELEAPN